MDQAAVTFRRTLFWCGREVHQRFSLLGRLATGFFTFLGLSIEGLRYRGGAPNVAESQHFDLEIVTFGAHLQKFSDLDLSRWLDGLVMGGDSAEFAGATCQGARLKEAGGPKPFIDADAGHMYPA